MLSIKTGTGSNPPSVSISGPVQIHKYISNQWTSQASDGTEPFEYQWDRKDQGGSWPNVGTSSAYSITSITVPFELRVTATDSFEWSITSDILSVTLKPLAVEITPDQARRWYIQQPACRPFHRRCRVYPHRYTSLIHRDLSG